MFWFGFSEAIGGEALKIEIRWFVANELRKRFFPEPAAKVQPRPPCPALIKTPAMGDCSDNGDSIY